jgi:PBP1b-binding outer membrane lipoprotein LpoB
MTPFGALARKPAEMTNTIRVPVCLLAALVLAGCQAPAPSTSANPTP